jgi:glycosyltransferase involved in cell wall biosynthesis
MTRISIVTPTLHRPDEVRDLLDNLCQQTHLPHEVILVDGAPTDTLTQEVVEARAASLPYRVCYIRAGGGTAIQRNVGIDAAGGDFVAFIDDDIRLEPNYFAKIMQVFADDADRRVGGVAGMISNQTFDMDASPRWQWYKRLGLFTTYEPGRYDFATGYPINRYAQPLHEGVREIDFMGSNCGVWRREVFTEGLRFDPFFVGFGVLEDAHFALRAGKTWTLLECGPARCTHLHSGGGRENPRSVARKTAVNYRYVFVDIVRDRTLRNELRFWRVQVIDLIQFVAIALRAPSRRNWASALGKFEGIFAAMGVSARREAARQ